MRNKARTLLFLVLIFAFLHSLSAATIVEQDDGYVVYDSRKSKEIEYNYKKELFKKIEFPENPGWIPWDCNLFPPIAFFFHFVAAAECGMTLKGHAETYWPEALRLAYIGTEEGGSAYMNYGIEVEAKYKLCKPIGDGKEKPVVASWGDDGKLDLRFFDQRRFTPFLLDGNKFNPVSLEDTMDEFVLFDGPLPIPQLNFIHIKISVGGRMYMEMFGKGIVLDEKEERSFVFDNEELLMPPPLTDPSLEVAAHYEALSNYEADFILKFKFEVYLGPLKFELPEIPFEIPIVHPPDYKPETWVFNSQTVSFDYPALYIPVRMHKFLDTKPGDEEVWEFEIENIGKSTLEGVLVSNDSNFIVLPKQIKIEQGQKTTATVFFKPYDTGRKTGVITFYSNDPVEGITSLSLVGDSTESETIYNKVKKGEEPRYILKEIGGCSLSAIDEQRREI